MDMKILFKKENTDMKILARETAQDIRKVLVLSIKTSYRGVHDHPFLAGFMFVLFLLYHFHPFLFACLVNSSPVIICTTLLLGTLLSYGDLNIPEIEEKEKTTHDVSALQTSSIPDDLRLKRDGKVLVENHVDAYAESSLRRAGEDSDDVIAWKGDVCNAESLLENRRTTEAEQSECEEGQDFSEVPDELEKMEFLTAHDEGEKRETIASGTSSEVEREVPGQEKQDDDDSEDREFSAGLFTDQSVANQGVKMKSDEPKKYGSIYSLLRSSKKPVDGPGDYSDSNSDGTESSPDASMADILPVLAELHPLLDSEHSLPVHINIDDSDDESDISPQDQKSDYSSEEEVVEGQEGEEPDEKVSRTRRLVMWTADDLKNVMDVRTSELERNRRVENLIAKRMARKNTESGNMMDRDQNGSLSMMNRYSHLKISPVRTRRINPFDHLDDTEEMKDLHPIPGSAPSSLSNGRNPYEFPFHHGRYSGNLMDDGHSHQQLMPDDQGNTSSPAFTRFASKDSFFRDDKGKKVDPNFKPYFLSEKMFSDEARNAQFQRQSSEMSDSRLSSVPESEPISSVHDCSEGLVEHEESEVISPTKQHGIATTVYDEEEREINLGSCYESIHNSFSTKEMQAISAPPVLETEEFRCEELPISYAAQSKALEDKCNDDNADEKIIRLDDTILNRMNSNRFLFSSASAEEMDEAQQKMFSSSETNNDEDDAGLICLDDTILKRINSNRYLFTGSDSKEPASESRRIEGMDKSQKEEALYFDTQQDNADGGFIGLDDTILRRINSNRYLSTESLYPEARRDNADGGFIGLDDTILKRMNSNRHLFTEPIPNDSLTSRKIEKMDKVKTDERQHADIRYSSLLPIETSTFDGDLLQPLLSPDSVTDQQEIFKTYLRQRSTNFQKDVEPQNEGMAGGSDEEEIVHSTEVDQEKFAGRDLTGRHLSDGNEEVEASNISMDEHIIPNYLAVDESEKLSSSLNEPPLQPSDLKIETIVTTLLPKTERTVADTRHKGINLTDSGSVWEHGMEHSNDLVEDYYETDVLKSEFKEMDESLLTELDAVGDYSVDRLTLDGNQSDQRLHLYSHSDEDVADSEVFVRKEVLFTDTLPEIPSEVGSEGSRVTDSKRASKSSTRDLDTSKDTLKLHIVEGCPVKKMNHEVDIPVLESASKELLLTISSDGLTQMGLPAENTNSTFHEESVVREEKFLDSDSSSIKPEEGRILDAGPQGIDFDMQEVEAQTIEDLHMLKQPAEDGGESPVGNTGTYIVDKSFSLKQDHAHSELEVSSKLHEIEAQPIEGTDLGIYHMVDAIEQPHEQFCKGNLQSMEPEITQEHGVHAGEKGGTTEQYMSMNCNELPPTEVPEDKTHLEFMEINKSHSETEVQHLEDMQLPLEQHAVNKESLPEQTEEGRHLDKAEIYSMMLHEIEAQPINDENSALKKISKDVDNDADIDTSAGTHEMEAPSYKDVLVAPKHPQGTSDDPQKFIEFKELSSEPESTKKDMKSGMELHHPNQYELDLNEDEQHAVGKQKLPKQTEEGTHSEKAEIYPALNETQAKSVDDTNFALKKFSEEINTDPDFGTSPTERHEMEAPFSEDAHVMPKHIEGTSDDQGKLIESKEVSSEPELTEKRMDSEMRIHPNICELDLDETQTIENMRATLNQASKESSGVPENVTQPKNKMSTIEVQPSAKTYSEMHEVEARSVEDILALRQLSMKIIEKSEDEEKFEDVSSDLETTETDVESDVKIQSDMHVVEAQSVEDINVAMKKYSERTFDVHDKKVEESNGRVTYGDNESNINEVQDASSHMETFPAGTASDEKPDSS